jgi:hypothetical protein
MTPAGVHVRVGLASCPAVPGAGRLSGNLATGTNEDIVTEMQSWINVPAPSDEFYHRLMAKAEADTEAWMRASGLADYIQPRRYE